MKVLFACGGTAGHIYPAVGVAGRIKELYPDSEFLFIGAKGKMEENLVPKEGYDIKVIEINNISRSVSISGLKHNIKTLKSLAVSGKEARDIISSFKPDVVVGTGGYVCYPVLKQAHKMGIPTLVHESNAQPGLTTKMLVKTVDCVMVGFEEAVAQYPAGKNVVVTGTPVRPYFRNADKASARAELGIPEGKKLVLSVWGSLGSDFMNGKLSEMIPIAAENNDFMLIHSCGKRGYKKVTEAVNEKCSDYASRGIDIREYIFDMPVVMTAADLVMSRSGASTLSELCALGKPAVLVPSPNVTNNHQEKNARVLEKNGAAIVKLEGEFDANSLYNDIKELLEDEARLEEMSKNMKASGVADATERIADMVLSYIKEK